VKVYKCTRCGAIPGDGTPEEARELLTVKKVSFLGMGVAAKTLRSRVVEWLCPKCVAKDEDWNAPAFEGPSSLNVPNKASTDG
jgi:rubredoxin